MTIRGAKFDDAAIVKLVRPQFAEFEPVSYTVVNATEIVAVFDLTDAPYGLYDVRVIDPDGEVATEPYRYYVTEAEPADVIVGLGGPAELALGETTAYGVNVYNVTNIDLPYVLIEFGVPRLTNTADYIIEGERLAFDANLAGSADVDGVDFSLLDTVLNLDGLWTASGFLYDLPAGTSTGLTFTLQAYPEYARLLAEDPDFLDGFFDFELEDLAFDFYIHVSATAMTAEEYVAYQTDLALQMRQRILDDADAPAGLRTAVADSTAWVDLYLYYLEEAGMLRSEDVPPDSRLDADSAAGVTTFAAAVLASGVVEDLDWTDPEDLVAFFERVREWYGHDESAYGSAAEPDAEEFDQGLESATHVRISYGYVVKPIAVGPSSWAEIRDPDLQDYFSLAGTYSRYVSMTGPVGQGDDGHVPADRQLPYTVTFTNPVDAESALTEIRIVTTLDEALDPRSFSLGDLRLGDRTFGLPDAAVCTVEFDLTEEEGYILSVSAGLDINTNIATFLIRAIDPTTGLEVTGDLSPLAPGEQGEIGYTIAVDGDSAQTAQTVTASARVFYNDEAARVTGRVVNTIDATAPTTTLEVVELAPGRYALSWSADDEELGSGVLDYGVFVSVNGGQYYAWLSHTDETSAEFVDRLGRSVEFVVIACDLAGNLESPASNVDLPPYVAYVNLGSLPETPTTWTEPEADDFVPGPVGNDLFTQAQLGVPNGTAATYPSAFETVFEPFALGGFAWSIPESLADIGPLGIAFAPDGETIYISGGAGRNELYVLDIGGGEVGDPLAVLDTPIYDMLFDRAGQLWATTGGGALVQIDPTTGVIIDEYGQGVTLGLALHPTAPVLYVATATGIRTFDLTTRQFADFSDTRVDGLAFAPDGTL